MIKKSVNFVKYLLILNILILLINNIDSITVNTNNGQVIGQRKTVVGREINVFLGIPYAKPPVGNRRFKKPEPVGKWSQPIQATQLPNPCYQLRLWEALLNSNFSEDCLYLNIWSPINAKNNAVMFFIHGGGLFTGATSEFMYNGEVLASMGDVVVVTTNYRLGALGFFYSGTNDAPGNQGFWDQKLALKWVNDNIRYFGGDTKRITLFGQSAGAYSVSLQILHSGNRNRFNNAIFMSGAVTGAQLMCRPKECVDYWLNGARLVGCADDNAVQFTPEIVNCMRNINATSLLPITLSPVVNPTFYYQFMTIDGDFIEDYPINLLRQKKYKRDMSLMVSTVSDEGVLQVLDPIFDRYNPINQTYNESVADIDTLQQLFFPADSVADIKQLYFNEISPSSDDYSLLRRTVNYVVGDYILFCPTVLYAINWFKYARNSKVYELYYNSKLGNPYKLICSPWDTTCHTNDLYPVFGLSYQIVNPYLPVNYSTDQEREESAQMIQFYSNFAKYGKPSPQNGIEWPEYYTVSGDNIIRPYFELTNNSTSRITYFGNGLRINACEKLWDKYLTDFEQ